MLKTCKFALPAVIALTMLGTGLPARADDQVAMADAKVVTIDEWDKKDGTMGLTLSSESIKTGDISFMVDNMTEMKIPHEILIIPNPADIKALKLLPDSSKLDEEKLDGLKEVVELEPGAAKSKVVNLTPGTYLVFCNQVGHFAAGMHKVLKVTE